MRTPFTRKPLSLLCTVLIISILSACNDSTNKPGQHTSTPFYTLTGGSTCVELGSHPQPPYTNVQVSHDSYLAHSEPMLVEDPHNPLHLVGGSKFFTDPAHYRFQIGYYASFDGGCTWSDGGVLPGFGKKTTTSDISFAFGTHNEVYAAVLYNFKGESGIAVSTSTDGDKTYGLPVSVFDDQSGNVFSDKPWIAVDQ